MVRVCVGVLAMVSVCGQAFAQVAAPSSPQPPAVPDPRSAPVASEPATQTPALHASAAPDAPGTGPRVDLTPKWVKGDAVRYEFEFMSRYTMFQSEEQGGKKGGELYRAEGRLLRRVLAVDDQGVTLSFMIERLHVQISTGTVVTHYDSDFGDDPDRKNDLTGPVKATVGRPITVRVDKSGKLVSVEGNEDPEPDPNQPENARPPRPVEGVIGTPEIRKLWRPLYALDKKSLDSRVGDRWTIEDISSDGSLGTFGIELHNELKGAADGVAHIDIIAGVDFTPAIGHAPVHATLTGSDVKGEIDWDTSKGMLKSWTTTQDMKMDMERGGEKQRRESTTRTAFTRIEPGAVKDAKDAPKPVSGVPPLSSPAPAAKP